MIAVKTIINAPIEKIWELWTLPEHIKNWNNASTDWSTPYVENDLRQGGKFKFTMTMQGGDGFDFEGLYTNIEQFSLIEYQLHDNRIASVLFENIGDKVILTETFEPERDAEMEEQFCTAIIQNFKKYVENFKE